MLLLLLFLSIIVQSCGSAFEPIQVVCEINGQIVPAMIDTGAEITVMSASCARRCKVHNLIDTQHSGKAIGVGFSEIVGGIEGLGMRIGPLNFQTKVSILRNSRCDFLIGLDVLERFKSEISLKDKVLKLNVRGDEVRIPLSSSRINSNKNLDYSSTISRKASYSWIAKREMALEEDERKFEEAKRTFRKFKFGITGGEEHSSLPASDETTEVDQSTDSLGFDDDDEDSYVLDEENISLEGV